MIADSVETCCSVNATDELKIKAGGSGGYRRMFTGVAFTSRRSRGRVPVITAYTENRPFVIKGHNISLLHRGDCLCRVKLCW